MFRDRADTAAALSLPDDALADQLEAALRRHVVQAWFPHCLDTVNGGFRSNFSRRWLPGRRQERMLEFQGRQTRTASRLALAYPSKGGFSEYALHGVRYLRDTLWDRECGGWYWRTSESGEPQHAATKHGHSTAYSVQACVLAYRATGERMALELAEEAFAWYDTHAHDGEFGGYHGWLQRDGTVIRRDSDVPQGVKAEDPLGHPVGLKDINVHGDWFEALLDLAEASEEPLVRRRLEELAGIYIEHLTAESGATHYAFRPDWSKVPGNELYGYGFQASGRFLETAERTAFSLPFPDRARAVLRHAVQRSAGKHGYAFGGPPGNGRPRAGERRNMRREWWVQVEALRALAAGARAGGPNAAAYGRLLRRQWHFIQRTLLDERYGGVYARSLADLHLWQRPPLRQGGWNLRKSDLWKDASHETDSFLGAIRELRRAAPGSLAPSASE